MRKVAYKFLIGLALVVLCADSVHAEIEGIQLQVDGLSCPFCAIGIDKHLKQQAGLEGIEVHLKQGVTEGKLPPGKGINIGKVRQAVQEAGFTLRGIRLTVTGTVVREGNDFTLISRGDGTRFLLYDAAHAQSELKQGGSLATLGDNLKAQLEKALQAKTPVRIEGDVHEHADLPPGLLVQDIELK